MYFCINLRFLSFKGESTLDNNNISIKKEASNEFDISKLKMKIANMIQNSENEANDNAGLCKNLACRCIATQSELDFYNQNKGSSITSDITKKQLDNDASNACLKLLNFLILDEASNVDKNLDLLFTKSLDFLDKQRGPNEIMVEVFYPIYTMFFQPIYQNLVKESNYSDPFIYDQRVPGDDGNSNFFIDDNENQCYNKPQCKDLLARIASTWKKVINIMNFDWKMGIGSMVANFYYLIMTCNNDQYWLQTNEQMWAPNTKLFQAPCHLNKDTQGFNELIKTITETLLNLPFGGVYLNDLVGYLGYSSTFDLSSLQGDKYMYNTRNLHPIHGMDTFVDMQTLIDEGWKQCNYLATYQNWVKLTSNLDKIHNMSKCNINGSNLSILLVL